MTERQGRPITGTKSNRMKEMTFFSFYPRMINTCNNKSDGQTQTQIKRGKANINT